jgi:hypothetical protein
MGDYEVNVLGSVRTDAHHSLCCDGFHYILSVVDTFHSRWASATALPIRHAHNLDIYLFFLSAEIISDT